MNPLNVLYHLALADFFERARRYRFLLTLAAVVYMGVLVISSRLYLYIAPGDLISTGIRGEFNSAWVGTMIVLTTNTFLGLFGFYLVSDCVERDIRTGVGQIIATTPVRRATYLVGKWFSNFIVLAVLELILAVVAVIMVLLKHDAALDLGALLMPFLAVGLPYMALTAALALTFETVPWLRGTFGNVVYFFLWLALIIFTAIVRIDLPLLKDPMGFGVFRESLYAGALGAFPNETFYGLGVQMGTTPREFRVFYWPGLAWTLGIVTKQWLWAVISLGLILLSATWFARFDPSREGYSLKRKGIPGVAGNPKRRMDAPELAKEPGTDRLDEVVEPRKKSPHFALPGLSPFVSRLTQSSPFLGVMFAELRLLLNGRRWWWWLVIAGLNVAILSNLPAEIKPYLLPFVWLWPLPIWSEMGNRERKNNTYQMVFASAHPVLRQLPAAWLAGVLATALFSFAQAVVFVSNGDLTALAGWSGAVVFVPALALLLGVFSSGSRVFEVVYLIWWYGGPFQKMPGLDFTAGTPQFYLLAAAGLLLSAVWRGRQVRV